MASFTEADHSTDHVILLLLLLRVEDVTQIVVLRDGDKHFEDLAGFRIFVPAEVEGHDLWKWHTHPIVVKRLMISCSLSSS